MAIERGTISLIYLYHISNNDQPFTRLCSANRFYWSKWGQERESPPPQTQPHNQPLRWLIKTPELTRKGVWGGILFQQLELPRDSSLRFCLVHLQTQKTASPCQSCPTRTQSSTIWTICLLSFIKCLIPPPPLVPCWWACVCVCVSNSCATWSI